MGLSGFIFRESRLNSEESEPVTLPVPEDYKELEETIPWEDGSVRILGITRMKPQTIESETDGNAKVTETRCVHRRGGSA